MLGDGFADGAPVHFAAAWDFDIEAALVLEEVEGVLWEHSAVPLGAFITLVSPPLSGEF